MIFQEVCKILEQWAPPSLQESYDNSGLITGEPETQITGILVSLDLTESVIEEAIQRNCNFIISHHPIWFQARKRLIGEDFVSRCLLKAIRAGIGLYAIHTNLDNVSWGVNRKIGERLGLSDLKVLSPRGDTLLKLEVYVPEVALVSVRKALFAAGAGHIGDYDECSFSFQGAGTFRPLTGANPYQGEIGKTENTPEWKIELILPQWLKGKVVKALKAAHPYEEVAFQIWNLNQSVEQYGAGMIGKFPVPMEKQKFLQLVKTTFNCGGIRYAERDGEDKIQIVAFCGGSGSFLIPQALAAGADAFVTADITYHKFFENEQRMLLLDIGHFESEQYTPELIVEYLSEKIVTFAVHLSAIQTNPIHYY